MAEDTPHRRNPFIDNAIKYFDTTSLSALSKYINLLSIALQCSLYDNISHAGGRGLINCHSQRGSLPIDGMPFVLPRVVFVYPTLRHEEVLL